MDNIDKNDEGTSVDQKEPEARAVEDGFEILEVLEANELEKAGETRTQDMAVEKGTIAAVATKEEIAEEPDKQEAHVAGEMEEAGKTDKQEVAGETDNQGVAGKLDKHEIAGETDKQEVAGETEKQEVAGETDRQEIADEKDKQEEEGETDKQEVAGVTDKQEIADKTDKHEVAGETEKQDVAGETDNQEVAGETDKQEVAGETDKQEVVGETDNQEVAGETGKQEVARDTREEKNKQVEAGETGKQEIAGEAKRQKIDEATERHEVAAKSKERACKDNWEKEGVNYVDFFQSGKLLKPCKLEFLGDRGLKIDNEEIILSSLRYATRRQYKSFPQKAAHCIIVSYIAANGPGAGIVKHSFLEMADDVNDTLNLEQNFNKLLRRKYLKVTDADQTSEDCLDTIYEQPLYFGGADVVVKDAKDKNNSVYEGRCVVVLDIECLTIYPVVNDELGDPHRLMFWKEEGENSVEKILHYSKKQKVAFETPSMVYELPVIGDIIEQLHELDPKVKGLLHDKALLHQWVTSTRRSKKTASSASASLYPEIHQAHEAEARRRPAHELENLPGASGTREWERQDFEKSIVQELNTELDNAVASFATNEDMQMIWITVEDDLRTILESGCVHETDHFSGGLDPDSADHLKRALNDVADQLSEQQLELAVSRIQAARLVFTASQNPEILNFLQIDDMELLRKLYFRSLVK